MTGPFKIITISILLVPFTLLIMAMPASLHAQRPEGNDQVREALEKTDEVIAKADGVIRETRSQKGRLSLEMARGIQTRAWNGFNGNGFKLALTLTLQAREEALRALALARTDTQTEENFVRIAEETHNRIARLRDLIAETGIRDDQSMRLIEEARTLLEKSHLNSQQLRHQLALKLAQNARQLAARAEERVRNARILREMADRKLSLLERLIERARERVSGRGDERAQNQLDRAERELEKAKSLLNVGAYREAKQALEACEKTLRSSVRFLPPVPPADPANRLEEAYRLLERAQDIVSTRNEPPDPKILEAIEQARALLREADEAIGEGRAGDGMRLVERAREMLRSAVREKAAETTHERVEREIATVEALREQARNLAEKCPAPGIRELMGRAEDHLRLAREHSEGSMLDSAWAEAAIARNIYQRISDLCAR